MARGLRAGRGVWKEEVTAPPSGKGQVPAFAGTGGCLSFAAWRIRGLRPPHPRSQAPPPPGSAGHSSQPLALWGSSAFSAPGGRTHVPLRNTEALGLGLQSDAQPPGPCLQPAVPHCPMTVRGHPPVRPRACSLHCPLPGHRWGAPGCRYQSVALSSPQCCSELPSGSLLPRTSPTLAAVGPWQKPEDPHCGGRRAGGVGDWAAAQQRPRHPHSQLCGRRASGAGAMAPALPVGGASGVGVGRQEESTIAT